MDTEQTRKLKVEIFDLSEEYGRLEQQQQLIVQAITKLRAEIDATVKGTPS